MTKLVTMRPRCTCLRRLVIDATLDQVDHAIREHLGVDAEIVLVAQSRAARRRGWRRCPSAESSRPRPARATCAPMASSTSVGGIGSMRVQRAVVLHERADPRQRHQRVAVRPRHLIVDLRHDHVAPHWPPPARRRPRSRACSSRGGPAARAAAAPRRAGSCRVRNSAGDVGQKDRHEVRAPSSMALRTGWTGEQRHRTEPAAMFRIDERRRAAGVQVIEGNVGHRGLRTQCLEQRRRRRGRAVHEHVHAAGDRGDCLFGGRCRRHVVARAPAIFPLARRPLRPVRVDPPARASNQDERSHRPRR